jgi:NADP-dependent 3-hydroxy acid dehydrogenase YdfG
MSENIEGKVIVITGASSGLGEAAARRLAGEGAKLILGARRLDRMEALAAELGLPAEAVRADVTDPCTGQGARRPRSRDARLYRRPCE